MDSLGILDLRNEKRHSSRSCEPSLHPSQSTYPLDLRIAKISNELSFDRSVECTRPSVITPNLHFSPSSSIQRSRWNHRSHPSIDSDSSFESEQENDNVHTATLFHTKNIDTLDATRCSSTESFGRRESMSSLDFPESDLDLSDGISSFSMGFYKELPELTANVSIGREERCNKVLKLSSCEAEVINAEDVQSELERDVPEAKRTEGECDESNGSNISDSPQIPEEAGVGIEELLNISNNVKSTNIKVGIQETANSFMKEIRKTKIDMCTSGLNLEVNGKKKQHCIKCREVFYSVAALLQHLMTHSSRNPGEKLIRCPVCSKRFSTLTTLEFHIQRLHTGEMKYVCEVCDAPYKFSTHLRKHMLTSRCGKGVKKNSQISP